MYKEDLALNNLPWLICYKTQPNPTKPNQTKPNQTKLNQIKPLFIINMAYFQYETPFLYISSRLKKFVYGVIFLFHSLTYYKVNQTTNKPT